MHTTPPQELATQQQQAPPLMSQHAIDRIVVSRLIEEAPQQYPQHPLHYLLGCYERADKELRALPAAAAAAAAAAAGGDGGSGGQQQQQQQGLRATVVATQELLVSYAGLILTGSGVVPEVCEA
jgi:hypothetical protein